MVNIKDNKLWQTYEKTKNQLREAGCIGLANEIYRRQLLLEDKLTKEALCRKSKNSSETSENLKNSLPDWDTCSVKYEK